MKRFWILGLLLALGCTVHEPSNEMVESEAWDDRPVYGPKAPPSTYDEILEPWRDPVLSRITDLPRSGECDIHYATAVEVPCVNLPEDARMRNYAGGSCVCASTISCLRWQGRKDLADELFKICKGGQSSGSIQARVNQAGIRYACTTSGDVKFLEWCARTRRGATIFWKPSHSCTLVDFTDTQAVVLDNNHVSKYEYTPRDQFIRQWRGYGGFALTPLVGPPAPPPPHL